MRISTRYIAALLPLLLLSLSVPADESTDAAAAAKTPAGISGFDFAGEFRRYAAGEKPCAWRPMAKAPGRPVGKVTVDGKAISFRGEPTDRWTGIVFSPGPRKERPATTPGMKLRFTVRMTGKGELQASAWHYGSDGKYLNLQSTVPFAPVPEKEGTFSAVITMPSRSRFFDPALLAKGECDLTITDLAVEALQ